MTMVDFSRPPPDACLVCGYPHGPDGMHQPSGRYHRQFVARFGRLPTFADRIAHCGSRMQRLYALVLDRDRRRRERYVIETLVPIAPDGPPVAQAPRYAASAAAADAEPIFAMPAAMTVSGLLRRIVACLFGRPSRRGALRE